MRYYSSCLLILWAMSSSLLLQAAETKAMYRVKSVSGYAMKRRFFGLRWEKLRREDLLYRDDMLLVGDQAQVKINSLETGTVAVSRKELTISRPFVARIDDHILRKVEVSVFFDKTFLNAGSSDKGTSSGFGEAWHQLMALRFDDTFSGTLNYNRSTISLGVASTEIMVSSPHNDEILIGNLPIRYRIAWEKSTPPPYRIYIWKSEDPRPEVPLEQTSQKFFSHKFTEYGPYNVQVMGADDSTQSRIIPIFIQAPLLGDSVRDESLALLYPPASYLVQADSQVRMEFYWHLDSSYKSKPVNFILQKEGGSTESIASNGDTRLERSLEPGLYRWRIQVASEPAILSEWRSIKVLSTSASDPKTSLFSQLWQEKQIGSVEWIWNKATP